MERKKENACIPCSDELLTMVHAFYSRDGLIPSFDYLISLAKNINASDVCILHSVVRQHDEKLTQALLNNRADIHLKDERGNPILFPAVHNVNRFGCNMLKILLDHGAEINATDGHSDTALHIATRIGDKEAVSFLLKHGADKDARGYKQTTPLYEAIFYYRFDVIDPLLEYGANIDLGRVESGYAESSIELAKIRNPDVVSKLLSSVQR